MEHGKGLALQLAEHQRKLTTCDVMKPERWQQLDKLFQSALAREPDERAAFLDKACAGDQSLRQQVNRLLVAHEEAGSFIERPAFEVEARGLAGQQSTAEPDLMVGEQISHYRIIASLGSGGMGQVFLAQDTTLGRKVALKLLPSEFTRDTDRVRRFQQEARAASALNHPNIITIYEIGQVNDRHFIATEFIDGETLRQRVGGAHDQAARGGGRGDSDTQLKLPAVLNIAIQTADALAVAHEAGIVHRDIKPENIMVRRRDGYVKVLDFGLAKLTAGPVVQVDTEAPTKTRVQTSAGLVMGTASYMSPEQARGEKVDARTDIWSLGVVLYEMIAGRRPFEGETASDVIAAILRAEPPLTRYATDIPAELERLVRQCLEKNQERRYQTIRDLAVDLKRAQRLKSAEAPLDQAPARSRWRRWGMGACITAALILVALVIFWWLWESDYFWQNPLAGARIERLTDFEGDEQDLAISPDGRLMAFLSDRDGPLDVWVSQIGSGDFTNVTKGQFPTTAPAATTIRGVGFSGDGAQVWISEGQAPGPYAVWLASAMGGAPRPFLDTGMEPAWSPDGSEIVYHTFEPGDPIFIADRTGSNPRLGFADEPGGHCHHLTWSPDGRFIYFVRGSPTTEEMDIWRVPVSASGSPSKPERITYHNARVAYPSWLDARTLIYSATAEDGSGQWLYAVDVERRVPHRVSAGITEQYLSVAVSAMRPRRLIASVANPSTNLWTVPVSDHIQTEAMVSRFPVPNTRALGPRYGSDYLLFLSSRGGTDGLWKLEKDVVRELWKGSDGGVVAPPAISPDGRQICFSYRKQGQTGLYVMNANGTNIRALAESLEVRGAASWSPDGKWVAVAANQREGTRVFKVPVDGGPPVRLLDTPSYHALWSPDGRFIIYCEPLKGGNFYWVDLDTGQQRQLTDLKTGFVIQSFDVTPDGKQIVFDRLRENSDIVMMDLPR